MLIEISPSAKRTTSAVLSSMPEDLDISSAKGRFELSANSLIFFPSTIDMVSRLLRFLTIYYTLKHTLNLGFSQKKIFLQGCAKKIFIYFIFFSFVILRQQLSD